MIPINSLLLQERLQSRIVALKELLASQERSGSLDQLATKGAIKELNGFCKRVAAGEFDYTN